MLAQHCCKCLHLFRTPERKKNCRELSFYWNSIRIPLLVLMIKMTTNSILNVQLLKFYKIFSLLWHNNDQHFLGSIVQIEHDKILNVVLYFQLIQFRREKMMMYRAMTKVDINLNCHVMCSSSFISTMSSFFVYSFKWIN